MIHMLLWQCHNLNHTNCAILTRQMLKACPKLEIHNEDGRNSLYRGIDHATMAEILKSSS